MVMVDHHARAAAGVPATATSRRPSTSSTSTTTTPSTWRGRSSRPPAARCEAGRQPQQGGGFVSDATYRVIELTGTSTEGVTEAMQSGVARRARRCATSTGSRWPASAGTSRTAGSRTTRSP
jgi:hypothetical protein